MPQRNLFNLFIPEHFILLTQIAILNHMDHITVAIKSAIRLYSDYIIHTCLLDTEV